MNLLIFTVLRTYSTMIGTSIRCKQLLLLSLLFLGVPTQNLTNNSDTTTGFLPCDALISVGLGDRILTARTQAYEPRIESYFSSNARYHPWCLFQPQNTKEVSLAISTLAKTGHGAGDWHIAIRSGGHGFPGASNIARGITIDLGNMNSSSYNSESKIASLGPGARWRNVYRDLLDKHNVTVTGGRDGGVGVGGFLLGGGISYYTGTNGFGSDTVVNYEVVLANGTVVQANTSSNADLFKALKGGGSNFGIITRFDAEATPAANLAYGQHIVSSNHSDAIIENIVDFTGKVADFPTDHLITLYIHQPGTSDTIILSIRVNTQGNMNTTAFDGLQTIPAISSSWNTTSLADASDASQIDSGSASASAALTFLSTPSILKRAAEVNKALNSQLTFLLGADSFSTTMVLQPMPTIYSDISQAKGGSMLPPFTSNAVMWTGGVNVPGGNDTALAIAETEFLAAMAHLREFARKSGALVDFVYMNYAHPGQDALGSYGAESVQWMREIAAEYDPQEFFQKRVPGGFKISRVEAA
ncbi:hypothetical protein DE146DRAFT_671737 [Phaeosphaeria sp. MPI-PUGE-AT-0046c]|nr:hypothetical protein DE146DRAFT_671737 [Phaeosphaeria sp. MPI-PUGE-AT-0046c]